MSSSAVIAGCGWALGRPFGDRLDVAIREAVLAALADSRLGIEDIDSFVTVASDTLDGISIPGRAEVAGNYGRRYLNVPSSAGHGLGAAATQIEAEEARNLVLVGWGAATKYADFDPRRNQADPFYARPVGASPRVVAAMQAHELAGEAGMEEARLRSFAEAMHSRAWGGARQPAEAAAPTWARTGFCDGAVALVMRRGDGGEGGVTVRDFASVSRPYSPDEERLDPARWVTEALGSLSVSGAAADFDLVEAAAPTPIAEARALSAVGFALGAEDGRFNGSGGGATAHFGAATALRQIAVASRELRASSGTGLVLDLCGPAGQHTTAIVLEAGARQ